MLNQIFALTWKELKIFFKDIGAVVFVFLQPFMFIVVMSTAMSGMFRAPEDQPIPILIVNEDAGTHAAAVVEQLNTLDGFKIETTWDGQPLDLARAEALIVEEKRNLALHFPADFSAALEGSFAATNAATTTVRLIADPATPGQVFAPIQGAVQGVIERTMLTALAPQGLDYLFEVIAPETPLERRQAFRAQAEQSLAQGRLTGSKGQSAVVLERVAPSAMPVQKFPDTYQQNVPGYTIYGIFWIVTMLASAVLVERRDGTFRRLLAAPLPRGVMLFGKFAPYYFINLLQLAVMLGASSLLFGMKLGDSPAGLIVVCLGAAAAATGMGVLVAGLARTEAQIGGLTTLLLLTMSALGGCFVPRFTMPEWLRTAGLITPHAWALDAFQDLFVRGYGLAEVLPKVGVLGLFAAAFFAVGVWRFRFE
ncbi:MAG: ABC transporter permease [Anaerolineae bacterium]